MKKIIVRLILIALIVAILSLYFYDTVVKKNDPTDNLFRTIAVVCVCLSGLARSFSDRGRQPLEYYDAQYNDFKDAFSDQPFWRNKLLCAFRLYNEGNYRKALKYLADLQTKCHTPRDQYTVVLFMALCFTDMNAYEHAETLYNQLIHHQNADSRIFSNLGNVQEKMGKFDLAMANYKHALEYDKKNPYAYNNVAQAYFSNHELEEAIPYALKALEFNPKMHQASALLAIIYSLQEDKENAEKYFHIAISSGRNPEELKEVIEYYRSSQEILDPAGQENA